MTSGFKYVITLVFKSKPDHFTRQKGSLRCCAVSLLFTFGRLSSSLSWIAAFFFLFFFCRPSFFSPSILPSIFPISSAKNGSFRSTSAGSSSSLNWAADWLFKEKKNGRKQMHKLGGLFCISCSFRGGAIKNKGPP